MRRFESHSKRLLCFFAFVLTAFLAGCGGGGGRDPILGIPGSGTASPGVVPVPGAGGGVGVPGTCAAGNLPLGTAASFGVLAGTALTITNPTSVTGDVGSPSITPAAGPSTLVGTKFDASGSLPLIAKAVTDMKTAIACANGRTCDFNHLAGFDFGGKVLAPGVHCVPGAMVVGSNLTLTNPGLYIFRSTGAFTTANSITVAYGGAANAANTSVFWVSSGAASGVSIGATSALLGTIMVDPGAATLGATTTLLSGGRVLSSSAVTLDTNTINKN